MNNTPNNNAVVSRSGRFLKGPAQDVADFTESISFDYLLADADIRGSKAHAQMLCSIGILTQEENNSIQENLDQIADQIRRNQFQWSSDLEDVHMNIEAELTRRTPAGAKLHTGRSRNDQVALDVRIWQRDAIRIVQKSIRAVQKSLLDLAKGNQDIIIPGYTHTQRAQPVYFSHHLLAYMEMFDRDYNRLNDNFKRTNVCPLGCGAIAGSTLPLDREMTARLLNFVDENGNLQICQNSMDGVSDRDFMVEFCSACSLIAMHISRLAEDFILWSTAEYGFIRVSDSYTTGSSLMPQKKNMDVAELSRGKTGRVYGNLFALLTLLKGLPMTYNRDLQEDKERVFDTFKTIRLSLDIWSNMLREVEIHKENCFSAASDPSLLATDLVDYLVLKGEPFRMGHHAVGALVALAEKKGCTLSELSLQDYQSVNPRFQSDVMGIFQLQNAMSRKKCIGSGGAIPLQQQLDRWSKSL